MEENKEFGTIDTRKEAFDKFKLAVLSSFETELDALLSGMENEDEIRIGFGIDVCNSISELGHRITINRHASKEISIRNPKTSEDLEPVSEMEE